MKIFIVVMALATIIGGFIGGELTDRTFSITGAAAGGVGLAAVLLGLGAFFSAQEEKKRKEDLPPEMREVFGRMFGHVANAQQKQDPAPKPAARPDNPRPATPAQPASPTQQKSGRPGIRTSAQCGQFLSMWLTKCTTANGADIVAKSLGLDNLSSQERTKKLARLRRELAVVNTSLIITAVNAVFDQTQSKAIIDTFLAGARSTLFEDIESSFPSFPRLYQERMEGYYNALSQPNAPLAISFAFMQNMEIDPTSDVMVQAAVSGALGTMMRTTLDMLRETKTGMTAPPSQTMSDAEIDTTIGSLEQFMSQISEWPEQVRTKALTIVNLVLDGKSTEAKAVLVTLPRQYGLVVINYVKQLKTQLG